MNHHHLQACEELLSTADSLPEETELLQRATLYEKAWKMMILMTTTTTTTTIGRMEVLRESLGMEERIMLARCSARVAFVALGTARTVGEKELGWGMSRMGEEMMVGIEGEGMRMGMGLGMVEIYVRFVRDAWNVKMGGRVFEARRGLVEAARRIEKTQRMLLLQRRNEEGREEREDEKVKEGEGEEENEGIEKVAGVKGNGIMNEVEVEYHCGENAEAKLRKFLVEIKKYLVQAEASINSLDDKFRAGSAAAGPNSQIEEIKGIGPKTPDRVKKRTISDVHNDPNILEEIPAISRSKVKDVVKKMFGDPEDPNMGVIFQKIASIRESEQTCSTPRIKIGSWNVRARDFAMHSMSVHYRGKVETCRKLFVEQQFDILAIVECPPEAEVEEETVVDGALGDKEEEEVEKRSLQKEKRITRKNILSIWKDEFENQFNGMECSFEWCSSGLETFGFIINTKKIKILHRIYFELDEQNEIRESIKSHFEKNAINFKPEIRVPVGLHFLATVSEQEMKIMTLHSPTPQSATRLERPRFYLDLILARTREMVRSDNIPVLILGDFNLNLEAAGLPKSGDSISEDILISRSAISNVAELSTADAEGQLYDNAVLIQLDSKVCGVGRVLEFPDHVLNDAIDMKAVSIASCERIGKELIMGTSGLHVTQFMQSFLESRQYKNALRQFFFSSFSDHKPIEVDLFFVKKEEEELFGKNSTLDE